MDLSQGPLNLTKKSFLKSNGEGKFFAILKGEKSSNFPNLRVIFQSKSMGNIHDRFVKASLSHPGAVLGICKGLFSQRSFKKGKRMLTFLLLGAH
jgi:hypothetical protein